jgi:hypothetical protein
MKLGEIPAFVKLATQGWSAPRRTRNADYLLARRGPGDFRGDVRGRGSAEYRRILLRYYTVFNVEQCEGLEIPAADVAEAGPSFDPIPACEAVYANMPHPLAARQSRALYPSAGSGLRERASGPLRAAFALG